MTKRKIKSALRKLAAASQRHYGARFQGIHFIAPDSEMENEETEPDAEVVVVLADGDWQFMTEKLQLAGLAFDILLETEVYIRAWPMAISSWRDPKSHRDPAFVQDLKRRAEPVLEAA
jgi:antitoxin ChpS